MIDFSRAQRGAMLTARLKQACSLISVGMIPVISGLLILYWQVDRSLMRDSEQIGKRAIAQLDRTLERADDLTAQAAALAGRECSEILEQMRRLVTSYPAVRSMVIGNQQQFYCGTELGAVDTPINDEMATASRLLLRSGSTPNPDHPSLVFRRFEGNHTLNAVIDTQVLAHVLGLVRNGADLLLEQNGRFLGEGDRLAAYSYDSHSEHHVVQISALYGYRVHSGYPPGYSLAAFKTQAWPLLGTLLLLGVVTAGACHLIARRKTPRPRRA